MDLSNHQRILSISIFSLILLNSANALCVPRTWTEVGISSPDNPPNLQNVSSPGSKPVPSLKPTSNTPPVNPQAVPLSVSKPASDSFHPDSIQEASSLPPINDEAIKNICHSTDYPLLCLASIKPYVNGRNDPLSVLEMAMRASLEHTKLAVFAMKKLATTSTSPASPSAIDDCKDSYDDALENINNALDALPARDIGTMNTMLSAAITSFGDCEDEYSGMSSLLPAASQKVHDMVTNCLAIATLIK